MRSPKFGLFLFLLFSLPMFGQTSVITSSITDSDNVAWVGGTYNIILVPAYTGTPTRIDNGQNVSPLVAQGTLDGSGSFSVTLVNNNNIRGPKNSQWQFKICPAVTGASCFTQALTINAAGTVNLSQYATAPRVTGGQGINAYADVEVAAFSGNTYYNLISGVQRCYTTSWANCNSGGGGGGVTSFNTRTGAVVPTSGDYTAAQVTNAGSTLNPLSQFAATSSAQLAGILSDETGSGLAVFGTSPALVTPNLGTPSALTLTNATGLPWSGVTVNSSQIQTTIGSGVYDASGAAAAAQTAAQAFTTSALTSYAPLASPALSGTPTAPTQAITTNNTDIATTAAVTSAIAPLVAYPSNAKTSLVCAGDSRCDGATLGAGMGLGSQLALQPFFAGIVSYTNGAVGGQTCNTGSNSLVQTYAAAVQPFKPNGTTITKTYLLVSDGENDVVGGVALATLEACYQGYVQQAVVDGFTPILIAEYMGASTVLTDAQQQELQAFDSWLLNLNGTNGKPYIVADLESLFPPQSSSPYMLAFTTTTPVASITAYSVTSGVATFTATNTLTASQSIYLWGFPSTSGGLNGQTTTVSATGLSGTSFQAAVNLPNVTSSTDAGSVYIPAGSSIDHLGPTGNLVAAQYINTELINLPNYNSTLGRGMQQETWVNPSNFFRFSGMLISSTIIPTQQGAGTILAGSSATAGYLYLGTDETDYVRRNGAFNTTPFPWTFTYVGSSNQPGILITGAPYTGGSATQDNPQIYYNCSGATAVSSWSTSGTIHGQNTCSGFAGNFLDFHLNGGTSLFKINSTGTLIFPSTTAPTMAPGTGAGTSPTCTTVAGNNNSGQISCTTGTSPTASATLATLTFNGTLASAPNSCNLMPRNAATALQATAIYTTAPTTTTWTIAVGTTPVAASTAYVWGYQCF